MAGCRVIQDDIDHLFDRRPRKEVSKPEGVCQRTQDFIDRARLSLPLQCTLHQIEVRVRHLKSQFLEPGGSRQQHIGETPRRFIHEQIDANDQTRLVETMGDFTGVREGRQHVGPQQEQNLELPVGQGLCDVGHLIGNIIARRACHTRIQIAHGRTVGAMTWAETAACNPKIAGQRRQTADRTRRVPAVGTLVHGAAAEKDHGWSRGRVRSGERRNLAFLKTGLGCCPGRREGQNVRRQFREADGMRFDKLRVIELFSDDDVHDGQSERSVRSRADQENFIRLSRRFRSPYIDRDDFCPATPSRDDMTGGIGLTRNVRAPKHDHVRVLSHILLGIDLERARQTHSKTAKPPTDHCRMPVLASIHMRETLHQLHRHGTPHGEAAMPRP